MLGKRDFACVVSASGGTRATLGDQPAKRVDLKKQAGAKKNPISVGCGWYKGVVADGCYLGQV